MLIRNIKRSDNRLREIVKPFTTIAVVAFLVICVVHILRMIFGWEVVIDHVVIPTWISGIGALLSGLLAVMVWKESR
jgi:hypothetical protein